MTLRESPRFDRSHWPQTWTDQWRVQVADFFAGRGGVGRALDKWFPQTMYFGVDNQPYGAEYPGRFVQADLLTEEDLPFQGVVADLIWVSFPCTAYSSLSATHYGSAEAALEANPRITDDLREWLLDHAAHYVTENNLTWDTPLHRTPFYGTKWPRSGRSVIKNVPRATDVGDLDANCRCNGLFFGEDFDLERHFETTFEVPGAYVAGDATITVDTRVDQSVTELAAAKGVPKEWGKQAVRSAVPWQFVWWVLAYCPSIPLPVPRMEQRSLHEFSGAGIGRHLHFPNNRLGGTDVDAGDELDTERDTTTASYTPASAASQLGGNR